MKLAILETGHPPGDLADPASAIASLDAPNDNLRVAGWIRRFLKA